MSDFVTPTVGPDQWVVATLICLFAVYFDREVFERWRTGRDGPD